jgi:hypothetical protein
VLGAIAQFEKATIVAKLAAARKRKRTETGRCEGREAPDRDEAECGPNGEAPAPEKDRSEASGVFALCRPSWRRLAT